MMRGQLSEQDRVVCARVITATNSAIENVFISTTDGYGDEW
jgi:hypothetical protein